MKKIKSPYLDKIINEIKEEATNRNRRFFIDNDINNIDDLHTTYKGHCIAK